LTPATSARPPGSMPSSSPPRRKAAGVAMCLAITRPRTGGAASAPAPRLCPASCPRTRHDLSAPAPQCQAHRRRRLPAGAAAPGLRAPARTRARAAPRLSVRGGGADLHAAAARNPPATPGDAPAPTRPV
jgi:hypothetical protein